MVFFFFFFKQISYYLCSRDNTIGLNMTNTFLVFAEEEIGEVLRIRLSWEGESDSWRSMWKNIKKNFWGWNANPSKPVLEVRRMRVKAGESQKKWAEGSKLQLPVLMELILINLFRHWLMLCGVTGMLSVPKTLQKQKSLQGNISILLNALMAGMRNRENGMKSWKTGKIQIYHYLVL